METSRMRWDVARKIAERSFAIMVNSGCRDCWITHNEEINKFGFVTDGCVVPTGYPIIFKCRTGYTTDQLTRQLAEVLRKIPFMQFSDEIIEKAKHIDEFNLFWDKW